MIIELQIELYINQGSLGMLSTMIETAMKNMISQMSDAVKPQIATSLTSSGVNISEQQLAFYDEPIGVSVEHINPIDNMGSGMMSANGNALAGMVTWMATLIATVAIYMTNKKHRVYDIKDSREKINSQLIGGAVSAVTSAFAVTMAVKYIIGFDIPVMETFVYEIFAVFGMMMLILGVMRWIGFGGLALAVLAMFLSMGTIYLPYNALPAFWQHWIYPWAPVRIIGQGLREIFFLDGGWFNSSTVIMIVLAAVGICLSYLSFVRKGSEEW